MGMFCVTDLDGTFLDDQKLVAPDAEDVLQNLRKKNHCFSIATSRSYIKVKSFLSGLTIDQPIIINNGAFIVDPVSGYAYCSFGMSKNVVETVLACGDDLRVLPIMLGKQGKESVYIPEQPTKEQRHFILSRPNDSRFCETPNPFYHVDDGIFSLVYHIQSSLSPQLVASLSALHLPVSITTMKEAPGIDAVEVLHQDANKGYAIQWLSSFSNIPLSDFIVFGDNGNDKPMFVAAGHSYAVANATLDIKRIASGVIGDNNSFAVVNFLKNIK